MIQPENYGYKSCADCSATGKKTNGDGVCPACLGAGLVHVLAVAGETFDVLYSETASFSELNVDVDFVVDKVCKDPKAMDKILDALLERAVDKACNDPAAMDKMLDALLRRAGERGVKAPVVDRWEELL
jgi:hypothetical protein